MMISLWLRNDSKGDSVLSGVSTVSSFLRPGYLVASVPHSTSKIDLFTSVGSHFNPSPEHLFSNQQNLTFVLSEYPHASQQYLRYSVVRTTRRTFNLIA